MPFNTEKESTICRRILLISIIINLPIYALNDINIIKLNTINILIP